MSSRPGLRTLLGGPLPEPTHSPRGYWLAILTAAITGVAFIAAKPVLGYLDPISFSISQFGIATVVAFVLLVGTGKLRTLGQVTPGQWTFLVVISILFLGAVYTMWIGLSRIPATAAALLNRLEVLMTVFLGMALLGDRFRPREIWGGVITLLGVVVLRYQAPPSFSSGFWMMVLSSVLFGFAEVLVKTRAHSIPPGVFVFARNLFVCLLFCLAALWRVAMQEAPSGIGLADWDGIRRGLPLIAVTAVVGPVFARTAYMYSLRHLDVSRVALIQQTQPVFVALLSLVLLHAMPSRREWAGGMLIIAGCLFLVQHGWRGRNVAAAHPAPPVI